MQLRVVQYAPKLILEWDPVPGAAAGYRGRAAGVSKWTQTQGTRMTFAANATGIVVQALGVEDEGTYPPVTPPPPTSRRGVSYFKDGNGELPISHVADYDFVFTSWGGAPAAGSSAAKKALVYMSAISCKPWTGWHYGVTAEELRAGGWQMKDAAGNELVNVAYGNVPLGDPGLPGYQQKWIANVSALVDQWGVDGIFIDDFGRQYKSVSGGRECDRYRGPANAPIPSYEAALASFANAVYSHFHARGKYVCWNAQPYIGGYAPSDTGGSALEFWPLIVDHADGLMDEFWNTIGQTNPRSLSEAWLPNLREPAFCETNGVDFHFHWQGSEAIGNYLFCSMLLEHVGAMAWWNGSRNQWLPLYDRLPLGAPLGPKTQNGSRFERRFQNGTVWVEAEAETGGIS